MHATLDRNREAESDALFFADVPDPASEQKLIRQPHARSGYGASRAPNWPAILLIAALHVIAFVALIKFDIIVIKKKPTSLVVVDIAEALPPPVALPKPQPKPVEIVPQVMTPPPTVQPLTPPPPQIVVTPPPPKPAPVVAPPSGVVTVGSIDEKMIEGTPPRYPMESRRKKEQGTVLLRLLIGTDGRVEQVSIAQSSGFDRLDQAVLLAAKNWRWQPMIRDGQPVEVRGVMPFTFSLKS